MFDWSYVILGIVTSVWFMGWVRPFHTWKQRLKQKIPTRPSKLYKYPILNFGHELWLEGWVDWDWTSWLGGELTFYKTGRGSYAEIQNNWVEHSTAPSSALVESWSSPTGVWSNISFHKFTPPPPFIIWCSQKLASPLSLIHTGDRTKLQGIIKNISKLFKNGFRLQTQLCLEF